MPSKLPSVAIDEDNKDMARIWRPTLTCSGSRTTIIKSFL